MNHADAQDLIDAVRALYWPLFWIMVSLAALTGAFIVKKMGR